MTPTEARSYLLRLPRFATQGEAAMRPGLGRVRAILGEMGDPQEAYPIVHVAGTNGKGSTASMVAAICSAHGLTTGLHTSPHLLDLTERMRVNGAPASAAWLAEAVTRYEPLFDRMRPSFFEATVALSLLYFADRAVDRAVVEVGMGGRLDATNVVTPDLAVITHIGLDHTQWLGDTLAKVAREKAGIIKEGVPVCVGNLPPEALTVIRRMAEERSAPLYVTTEETTCEVATGTSGLNLHLRTPECEYDDLTIGIGGPHQHYNAAVAVRCAELLLPAGGMRTLAVRRGLENLAGLSGLRGRFEQVSVEPPVIIDVAHNAASLEAVLQSVARDDRYGGRLLVALGLMGDKDVVAIAHHLRSVNAVVWPVDLGGDRAMSTSELGRRLQREGVRTVCAGGDLRSAIEWYEEHVQEGDILLATGSHRVVSRAFRELDRRIRKTN